MTDENSHLQAKVSGFKRNETYPDPASTETGLVSAIEETQEWHFAMSMLTSQQQQSNTDMKYVFNGWQWLLFWLSRSYSGVRQQRRE